MNINRETEKGQVKNWLTHKLADQSRKILKEKKRDKLADQKRRGTKKER